jgi:hypothetical protein
LEALGESLRLQTLRPSWLLVLVPGFFLGGATSASKPSDVTSDLRFVDRVLHTGKEIDTVNSSSSERGAIGMGENGNSRACDSASEQTKDSRLDSEGGSG